MHGSPQPPAAGGAVAPGRPFDLRVSLTAFLDAAPDAMVIVGPDGVIRQLNRQAAQLFGYEPEELAGRSIETLIPARYRQVHPAVRSAYAEAPRLRPMGSGRELHGLRKDGSEFPAEISLGPVETPDGTFVTAAVRDLTERLRQQEESRRARQAIEQNDQLTAALREREILLQEVHHRVKNNLQVISSLINMQRRAVADAAARDALRDCQARVQAIGLIHEQLYRYADYARVPFADYVRGLVVHLSEALGSARVRVAFDVAPVALAVDKAIPCGLIVNELVTNAFKHAFPGDRGGTISVRLSQEASGRCELAVEDDGVGSPSGEPRTQSLGLHLVDTLVAQLRGVIVRRRDGGTSCTVSFPLEVA